MCVTIVVCFFIKLIDIYYIIRCIFILDAVMKSLYRSAKCLAKTVPKTVKLYLLYIQ